MAKDTIISEVQLSDLFKFKIETWESNKGSLGCMGWALYVAIPELEQWYKLEGSHRYSPLHPDNAERQARLHMGFAIEGFYNKRIRDYIIGAMEDE